MRVVLLGKQRYRERSSVALFLAAAPSRGHAAILLDRDGFLAAELDDVDVVLAKSHYKDEAVADRLRSTGVRVLNDLDASAICASRRLLADHLHKHGIPTPHFLGDLVDERAMALPWIAKPDDSGDHQLNIIEDPPAALDLEAIFYQQWLPTRTVMKVYSVGRHHDLVQLEYSSARATTDPKRNYVGPAAAPLADAAKRIAAATGLTVFNTDFIDHNGALLAIDVNPFPGLESIPNSHNHLWDLIES